MRGEISSIQQTLTQQASTILTLSIAEAARRNHAQTTPLHVASTLLSSPTSNLRQACIRSHPTSSHPLHCRALELCFTVALDRLPAAGPGPANEAPPLSNALLAAIKRAQTHQRRGCHDQQKQPLLAVKVDVDQFVVSILDDPSVSRVMREASFSSPAVKVEIEKGVGPGPMPNSIIGHGAGIYLNPRLQQDKYVESVWEILLRNPVLVGEGEASFSSPAMKAEIEKGVGPGLRPNSVIGPGTETGIYLNHGLQQQQMLQPDKYVEGILEILLRPCKKNPVLVGEGEAQEVVREVVRRVGSNEIRDRVLQDVDVVVVEEGMMGLIEDRIVGSLSRGNGVVLDVGDLKWLVGGDNQGGSDMGQGVVSEIGRVLRKYGEGSKVWVIGYANCETYMRCQVYYPCLESEWDLQVVSILARSPFLPRLGNNGGISGSSISSLSPIKSLSMATLPLMKRVTENLDLSRRFNCCPQCSENCNQELAKLQAEKSLSEEKPALPLWLQNSTLNSNDSIQNQDQGMIFKQKTQELQRKWLETCQQLHPSFHQGLSSDIIIPSSLSMTGLYNPDLLGCQPFQLRLQPQKSLRDALQLSISSPITHRMNSDHPTSSPVSPVRTDLALGRSKPSEASQDKSGNGSLKDFLSCISSESPNKKFNEQDADSYKKLLKGLMEKVWWQTEAASALASAITQCESGSRKRVGSKGDRWLVFSGPDRIGKKRMASALSELLCGVGPILISLGSRRDIDEPDSNFRGKAVIDRIAEAVKRNPFSVIMLQDIDEADLLIQGSIRRAIERGRLVDSYGREISLGKIIFIFTSNWLPEQFKSLSGGGAAFSEEKLISMANGDSQLRISVGEKPSAKRSSSWFSDDDDRRDRATKRRPEAGSGCLIDLNQTVDIDNDRLDGSHNSSDLTVDHEEEPTTSSAAAPELITCVDETIIFKPIDFTPIRQNIERTILTKFSNIAGDKFSLEIQSDAMDKILSGIWLGQTTIESWVEKVLTPSIHELNTSSISLPDEEKMVAQLELDNKESENHIDGVWLPEKIAVVARVQ